MPIPMPSSWFLLLLLLPYTSTSTPAPDVDLDYIIKSTGGDASASNNPEDGALAYLGNNRYGQDLFANDDGSPQNPVDEAHVVLLTAANFSSFLAARRHVMVDFYVPWCSWSRKLAPEYAAAASHLADTGLDVALAKVDVAQNNQLALAHDVLGSPTVHFFIDGVPRGYRYYGERTKDAVVAWITKKLGPAVRNVTTVDEAEKIITGGQVAVLAFLDSLSGAHSDELDAASRLEDTLTIFETINFYQTINPDVAKLFNFDPEAKRPSLVLVKKEEDKLTVYDGEFRASAIADFVSMNKHTLTTYHPHKSPFNFY